MNNKKIKLRKESLCIYTQEEIKAMIESIDDIKFQNKREKKIKEYADYMTISRYMTMQYCILGNFEQEESFEDFILRYVLKLLKRKNKKETSICIFEKYFKNEKETYKTLGEDYGVSTERIRQHIAFICRWARKIIQNEVYKGSLQIKQMIEEREKDIADLYKVKFTDLSQKQNIFVSQKEWNENKKMLIRNWRTEICVLCEIKKKVDFCQIDREIEDIEEMVYEYNSKKI